MGGSFDPIHNGHIHLCQVLKRAAGVHQVLLMPAAKPPHKRAVLTDGEHRLEMCRIAAAELDGFAVSNLELTLPQPSYTVNTLKNIRRAGAREVLYFFCGADMFLSFDSWYHWEEILQYCVLCAIPRGEGSYEDMVRKARKYEQAGGKIILSDVPELPISSTLVRQRVQDGQSIAQLVPPGVEEYIYAHHLYQNK